MRRILVAVAVLGLAGPAFAQQPRPGQIQQFVAAGAMLPGQRLPIEVYVRDLQADQEMSVRVELSESLERVDPRCAPDGAAYVCNLRAGPLLCGAPPTCTGCAADGCAWRSCPTGR